MYATCMHDIFLTASTLISTQLGRIKGERAIDQVNMVKGICLGDVHSWGPYEDKHTIEDLLFWGPCEDYVEIFGLALLID